MSTVPRLVVVLLLWIICFAAPGRLSAAGPGDLEVVAASDLRFALVEIAAQFERMHGVRVRITLGSSGQLAAQIVQGAPFDVFFSADEAFIHALIRQGAVRQDSVRLYALGRIVVWVRAGSPLDVTQGGLGTLTDRRVRYVAIANPAHAPYGRAAEEALRSAGAYERVKAKLVLGENVTQALQFAQTGNADAAIVALSLAVAPPVRSAGRYWVIPSDLHRPIRQAAGITTTSRRQPLAEAFLDFVTVGSGREVLRQYGFGSPPEQP